MFKDKLNYKLLNTLILAAIAYLGLITMDYWGGVISKVFSILLPFLISFGIAYSLYPLVRKLRKKGLGNKLSVTIVSVSVIFIIVGLIAITIPVVYDQLLLLSKNIGEVIADISTKFEINLGDFQTTINGLLDTLIKSVGKFVSDGTFEFVGKSVDFVTNTIIIIIVSIYFLADMESIRKEVKRFLTRPKSKRKTYNYVRILDKELAQYLNGLAIFICIQFIEYSLIFRIIGHPNWLLLGILAALTTVIPYFGGLITNIIAVILASVVSTPLFIATLVVCLIFPNIDGYIISPKVYGKTNNVDPVWSIFAVIAGGSLFGIVGIMISLPLYIAINCTFKFYKEDIYDKIEDIKEEREQREIEIRK